MEDVHGKQKEASTDTASECQDMFQVSCFSRALFSVCDDSNTDEGEREREREGGRWKEGGSAFARLSAYGLSKEQRKRKREAVLMHCVEEMHLHPGCCCCCQLPLPHSNGKMHLC